MVELTDEEIEDIRLSIVDRIGYYAYQNAIKEKLMFGENKINEEQPKSKVKVIKK